MTFDDWMRESKVRVERNGVSGAKQSVLELGKGMTRRLGNQLPYDDSIMERLERNLPIGEYIYEHDWDVLVILDACRADLMKEVESEYPFVDSKSTYSVAGGSRSWLVRNFSKKYREEIQNTIYVTGNPFSEEILNENWFENLVEVWRYAWDDEINTIPARAITDAAIHEHRERSPNRMVIHYMQPHHPFVPNPMDPGMNKDDLSSPEDPIWQQVKRGEVDQEEVWNAYRENLRYVLDEVNTLLKNIESESVVISADHGNAVGEWGFYGHGDIPVRAVRKVPWCRTTAKDERTRLPDISRYDQSSDNEDIDREKLLRDLGYL